MSLEELFKHQILSFYTQHKRYRFFVEQLREHIKQRDVQVNFFLVIF
jgi:hypothetical protein